MGLYMHFSKVEDDIIRAWYPSGGSKSVKQYIPNRSCDSIRTRAKKLHIKTNVNIWTRDEDNLLRLEYPSNPEVFRLFDRHTNEAVLGRAKKLKVRRLPNVKQPIYSVNYDFFKTWSPDMAYIIGFLLADGCIAEDRRGTGTNKVVTITLKSTDEYILEQMRKACGRENPVHMHMKDNRNYSSLTLGGTYLCNILANYKLVPRKSLTCEFPVDVPDNCVSNLILGYFDGDGGVYIDKKYNYLYMRFSGTKQFLEDVNKQIVKFANIKPGSIVVDRNIWRLNYHGPKQCKPIYNWLYSNANMCLTRKKVRFERIYGEVC